MKTSIFCLLSIFLICSSCREENKASMKRLEQVTLKNSAAHPFTKPLVKGHHSDEFLNKEVLQFDIDLNFRGKDRMDATVYLKTNSSGIRIDKTNGSSLIFDGENVYQTPENAPEEGARFDVFTWPYFFALPYKLNDPGTQWEDLGKLTVRDTLELPAGKLSFESGTGDAPDDWYVVYYNLDNGLIHTAGYIVTFGGKAPEKAEENAHAICYHDYRDIDGIPIATRWTFHNWNRETGLEEQLGEATLRNFSFIPLQDSIFLKPANSKEINL